MITQKFITLPAFKRGMHLITHIIDEELNEQAKKTGLVKRTLDLEIALKDADYVHTDTWMDMEFFENGKVKTDMQDEFKKRTCSIWINKIRNKYLSVSIRTRNGNSTTNCNTYKNYKNKYRNNSSYNNR